MGVILQFGGDTLKYEDVPEQPKMFHAYSLHETSQVKMTWENPTTDKNFAMVKIIRKVDSVPHDFNDGTEVYSGTGEVFVDSDVEVSTTDNKIRYFYRIFACNAKGQPNMLLKGCYQVGIVYDRSQVKTLADVVNDFVAEHGSLQTTGDDGNYEYVPICFGRYKSTDTAAENKLIWKIVDRQCMNSDKYVSLVGMTNLGIKVFDQPENASDNTNPNNDRKNYGNNRYLYSNIRQWLNSNKEANNWYAAQHDYDNAPSYKAYHGFLHEFTEEEIGCIVPKDLKLNIPSADGGGTETMNDLIWLMSVYEAGLAGTTAEFLKERYPDTQKPFEVFSDNASRMWSGGQWYWLRSPFVGGSSNARYVYGAGALYVNFASYGGGVRPGLNLTSSLLVKWSDEVSAWEYVPYSGGINP